MYVNNFLHGANQVDVVSQNSSKEISGTASKNEGQCRLGLKANELATLLENQILQNEDDESLGLSVFIADATWMGDDLASQLPDTYYYSSIYYPPQKAHKGLLLKLSRDEFQVAQNELLKRGALRPSLKSASGFITYRYIKALSDRRMAT